jgi:hypothetical protein
MKDYTFVFDSGPEVFAIFIAQENREAAFQLYGGGSEKRARGREPNPNSALGSRDESDVEVLNV